MHHIIQNYPGRHKVRLTIGDGFILEKPTVATTVLGSCVSVTFHCQVKKIGAIFHAIMPVMPEEEQTRWTRNNYRYVDSSIRHVVRSLYRRGVKQHQIEAKVFGGAQAITTGEARPGPSNIRVAFELLTELNIKILASDVGGKYGRNLVFISDTGEVFIKTHKNCIMSRLKN
jgi:chemotaxis protein CheD